MEGEELDNWVKGLRKLDPFKWDAQAISMKILELIRESGAKGITVMKMDPPPRYRGKATQREKTKYTAGALNCIDAKALSIMYNKNGGNKIQLYEGASYRVLQFKCGIYVSLRTKKEEE